MYNVQKKRKEKKIGSKSCNSWDKTNIIFHIIYIRSSKNEQSQIFFSFEVGCKKGGLVSHKHHMTITIYMCTVDNRQVSLMQTLKQIRKHKTENY